MQKCRSAEVQVKRGVEVQVQVQMCRCCAEVQCIGAGAGEEVQRRFRGAFAEVQVQR